MAASKRWKIEYRVHLTRAPLFMVVEAPELVPAMKYAQMRLADMDGGPYLISGCVETEDPLTEYLGQEPRDYPGGALVVAPETESW